MNAAGSRLRPMAVDDIDAVMAIERELYDFPWSYGIFHDCIGHGYCCLVCEVGGELIGYGVLSSAAGESHLLNLCIHDAWQRRGLGRTMLHALLGHARESGATVAFLEVRPSNGAAVSLYRDEGFRTIGYRKGYYPGLDGREDAVVMSKEFL